jgi:hypothetical protein
MAKTQTQAQATAAQAVETYSFRVVIRGNVNGARVRRVRTIQAADAAQAYNDAGAVAAGASDGMENVFYNVFPPVGMLCNGGLSKGFEVVDGYIVRTATA